MLMYIRYIYNDVDSVNKIYAAMNKRDRFYIHGGKYAHNDKDYIWDPKGDFATKYVKQDDFGFIVTMIVDGKPVAYFCCMRAWSEKNQQYTASSEVDFAVHPRYRGRGFGTLITRRGMSIIKKYSKFRHIEWFIVKRNRASEKLAQKNKFRYAGETISHDKQTVLIKYVYDKKGK